MLIESKRFAACLNDNSCSFKSLRYKLCALVFSLIEFLVQILCITNPLYCEICPHGTLKIWVVFFSIKWFNSSIPHIYGWEIHKWWLDWGIWWLFFYVSLFFFHWAVSGLFCLKQMNWKYTLNLKFACLPVNNCSVNLHKTCHKSNNQHIYLIVDL